MANSLTEQIAQLKKNRWFNLQALVDFSTAYLCTAGDSPSCESISLLGTGTYHHVYRLVFSNGIQLAGSVTTTYREFFDARAMQSEIATMKFVRDSGLYPDVPVPKVHAWSTTFDNPVGAPYVLMDVVEGQCLRGIMDQDRLFGLDTLSRTQQFSIVKALAKLQAALCKPIPFSKIGSLIVDPDGGGAHSVGPFVTSTGECLGGPFESIEQFWRSLADETMLLAVQEWCNREKDDLPSLTGPEFNPQTFAEVFQLVSSLIPHFTIPKQYNSLVLHHPDIALRNVIFDKESLLSDEPKITGVIDWGGAQIIPLLLTAHYPDDLVSSGDVPFKHLNFSYNEDWRTIPFDWTSIGDSNKWPKLRLLRPDRPFNSRAHLAAMVRQFYLRTHFSACFAEQMHILHGDAALLHATLFADAPYYLKFHEMMLSGWTAWLQHAGWIRETYWRLRTLGGNTTAGESFIMGPNIYRGAVVAPVIDLTISEELPPVEEEELFV